MNSIVYTPKKPVLLLRLLQRIVEPYADGTLDQPKADL